MKSIPAYYTEYSIWYKDTSDSVHKCWRSVSDHKIYPDRCNTHFKGAVYYVAQLPPKRRETYEPCHEISNNVVCATSKGSDQPAHTRSLIGAIASRLNILWVLSYWPNITWSLYAKRRLHRLIWVYTCQNATLLEITCRGSYCFWCQSCWCRNSVRHFLVCILWTSGLIETKFVWI